MKYRNCSPLGVELDRDPSLEFVDGIEVLVGQVAGHSRRNSSTLRTSPPVTGVGRSSSSRVLSRNL